MMRLLFAAALLAAPTAAASPTPSGSAEDSAAAAHAAWHQVRDSSSIRATLDAVQLPAEAARKAEQLMGELGVQTTLDLQLLAQTPAEAEELMSELSDGGLVVGHRAKVRLLLGGASANRGQLRVADDAAASECGTSSSARRQLQGSEGSGGLSNDTLAIVFSVLVGAVGYLVQAHTARRAERAAAEAAQEQQVADTARERLHQQMASQIRRIDRALDDCSRPLSLELHNVQQALAVHIDEMVTLMQPTQPEAVTDMVNLSKVVVTVSEDGTKAVSSRSGRVMWDAATARTTGLLRVEENAAKSAASAAGTAVSSLAVLVLMSQPYTSEMPHSIVSFVASDPDSPLARLHQLFVRNSLLPSMREVARLLRAHSALMELPPTQWLKTKFPAETWGLFPASVYLYEWLFRTQQWEALVSAWDAGHLDTIMPAVGVHFPLGGLTSINNWALARGEGRQRELIGMTTEVEAPQEYFGDYGKRLTAAAGASAREGDGT